MASQRDELIKIFYFIWLGIIILILTPLTIYYCVEFWRLKHKIQTFDKRYPKYVIICVAVILFHVVIIRTVADLPEILDMTISNEAWSFYFRFNETLYYTIHIIYIMLLIRAWFLYIDYTKNEHLITLSWQKQISQKNTFVPWSLRYKWMRNIKLICLLGAIYWIFVLFVVQITLNVNAAPGYHGIVSTVSCIIIAVVTLTIICKIRQCKDDLFIHFELRYIGIIILIIIPLQMEFILIWLFGGNHKLLKIVMTVFVDICLFSIAFISTKYIVYKYKKQSMRPEGTICDIRYKDIKLTDVLETKHGFDLFASFLVNELSIEHLTFLFEIMQLKYNVWKNLHVNDVGLLIKIGWFYMKKIEQSNVSGFETYAFETISFILFNYIEFDAQFSINISSRVRQKTLKQMEDILSKYKYMRRNNSILKRAETILSDTDSDTIQMSDIESPLNQTNQENELLLDQNKIAKCVKSMDIVIEEVLKLLSSDSYMRFMQTVAFGKLVNSNPQLMADCD